MSISISIRQNMDYKCQRYGSVLTLADRFFPSSQLCSNCGHRQKMPISIRVYNCPSCQKSLDRDFNVSLNLENYTSIAVGLTALRSRSGVLPTVPCEVDSKHQSSLSSFG